MAPIVRQFKIGNRDIGGDAPVFIIAELSANHGHRKDIALRSIDAAADAGADAIKLQTYTPDTLTLKSDAAPFVVKSKNEWSGRTLHDLYAEAMTPWEWHADLMAHAKSRGLECFSTPFDATAVAFLEKLNVPCHKVASFELNDLALVETIARTGKPMIMSTGMATLEQITEAIAVCHEAGNHDLAVLRCVSCYPAKPESMDLRSYDTLRELDVVLGLSDHTRDTTVAIASVALGAKVIEKHFIMDRSIGGPDAFFSLDPAEFTELVRAVRTTTAALGKSRFGPSEDEVASTAFRRSLFVSAPVKRGETFTAANVRSVRPSHGLDPRRIGEVLGRIATRDIAEATPLADDMIGPSREVPAVTLRAASSERRQYVAERDGKPVGTLSLDANGPASLDVSLDAGSEDAPALLRAAEQEARSLGAVRLVALLRPDDAANRRAFEAAGYHGFVEHSERGATWIRCERRIAPYQRAGDRS